MQVERNAIVSPLYSHAYGKSSIPVNTHPRPNFPRIE